MNRVGVVFDRTISPSDPELFVDQVGNLSTSKETVLLLGLLFLQTDLPFEMGIMDDLFFLCKKIRSKTMVIPRTEIRDFHVCLTTHTQFATVNASN